MSIAEQSKQTMTDTNYMEQMCECLTQQISEFELLKSMFPRNDEIILTDCKALDNIEKYLQKKSEHLPNYLDFVVNLYINSYKFEVCVDLSSLYPIEEPDIYVRCNNLNRQQQSLLNSELSKFIKNNHVGEVCLYTAISWLQDKSEVFINDTGKIDVRQHDEETKTVEDKFARMWIYSHHIYNKKKREEIMKLGKELHLTGFCLPGKPGIICIEGPYIDCLEWWKYIKSLNWQKIVLKTTEIFETSEQEQEQKFYKFEEIGFSKSSRNEKHQDMGAFSKFMEERGLTKAFNECFGFDV